AALPFSERSPSRTARPFLGRLASARRSTRRLSRPPLSQPAATASPPHIMATPTTSPTPRRPCYRRRARPRLRRRWFLRSIHPVTGRWSHLRQHLPNRPELRSAEQLLSKTEP